MEEQKLEEKELKEKEEKEEEEGVIKRVNDILTISYLLNSQRIYTGNPTYTHQIFENEEIKLSLKDQNLTIEIEIDINSLQSHLILKNASQEIQQQIIEKISPLLSLNSFDWIFDSFTPKESFQINNKEELGGKNEEEGEKEKELIEFYVLTHLDSGANELLSRGEKISMWYIETASSIDFNDNKWEVIYMIKKIKNEQIFIGYCTLYTFHNPFLGSKIRICQVLILPPFQRQGIGRLLLLFIYNLVSLRSNINEITVEDPSDDFQTLRDLIDLEWYINHYIKERQEISTLKLTSNQIHFIQNCYEFHQLKAIKESLNLETHQNIGKKRLRIDEEEGNQTNRKEEEEINIQTNKEEEKEEERRQEYSSKLKEFRLKNKRYLLQQNGELKGLEKKKMQNELNELYQELEQRYEKVERKFKFWE